MKKIFTLLTVILISLMVLQGQDAPPQAFSFKATIVSKTGSVIASKTVAIRLSILKNSTNGISVFTETFLPKTNEYGQVDILIGNGTRVSGNFSTIEWSNDKYFLKIEVDVKGGRDYVLMSVTQLLSVPYAMYAKSAGGITGGITETDPVFVSSPAYHISTSNLNNWNTAFGWGNHAGLYRPIGYVPAWIEITSNPFSFSSVQNNQILKYNSLSGKWENWTPTFSSGTAETDPVFTAWNKSSGISIASSQVSDFQENVTNNAAVMANSAKNSYPAADAAKLASIAAGAEVNVNADWNATGGDAQILNKPTLSAVATTGSYNNLTDKPDLTIYATKNMANQNITNLANPVNSQDAATKAYVDNIVLGVMNSFAGPNENFTSQTTGSVTDSEGNNYNIIKIGNQWWMAENLKSIKYNDGTPIQNVTDGTAWFGLTTGAYAFYDNNEANNDVYGALYNWYAVNTGNLCPTGWHVPGKSDWIRLTDYLGGGTVAGGKMKETGTTHWLSPNTGATNVSGFSALPAGNRQNVGSTFANMGSMALWWSATESTTYDVYNYYLFNIDSQVHGSTFLKVWGFSVRCLRN